MGGDAVQMHETARALRSLGVEVEERLGPQNDYSDWDLVHLFNLQTPAFTVVEAEKAKTAGRKLAVSTIFWDFAADLLVSESRLWGKVASILGRRLALALAQRRVDLAAEESHAQVRRILQLADVGLPNSEAEIAHLKRIYPDLGTVRVVPNGIDIVRFDPSKELPKPSWAPTEGYVLVAARLEKHKNQAPFCRALQGFEGQVVLCGNVADQGALAECQSAGAIHVGPLFGDELAAAYKHARVHALPSFRETPGLASLEAAAMGCAIVTTHVGSTREYFKEEANYCDPGSAASMRQAVESAWASGAPPGLRARVRREFTWEAAAKASLAAYEDLLAG